MHKLWLIFWREYWSHLVRKSYLIFTFGFPAFVLGLPIFGSALVLLAVRQVLPQSDPRPLGVVDASDFFPDPAVWSADRRDSRVALVSFDSVTAAAAALQAGQIQAYYTISPSYLETGAVTLTYDVAPTDEVQAVFQRFVEERLRADLSPEALQRAGLSTAVIHRSLDGQREYSIANLIEWGLIYFAVYFTRLASSFTAGYTLGSISSESDDSTLEILITSVTPLQFVLGKLTALLAVGLTQLAVWGLTAAAIATSASLAFGVNLLEFIFAWRLLPLALALLLSAYVLDQIVAGALGILRVRGGAGLLLFNTLSWITGSTLVYAAYLLPRNPDTPLAIVSSLVPFTAPIVLLVRAAVSSVPPWQTAISIGLLWLAIGLGVWQLSALLKRGLVTNAQPFQLRRWLRAQWRQRWPPREMPTERPYA